MRAVRVLVAEAEGSVPREAGAVMWVFTDGIEDTIGGGTLEHEAIVKARAILASDLPEWRRELRSYPLGPALGQCCGGMVRLLFEVVAADKTVGWVSAATAGPCADNGQSARNPTVTGRRWVTRGTACTAGPSKSVAALTQPTGSALVIRSLVAGTPPILIIDRRYAADLPLPVLRAVRAMLSGARPRATLLIRGQKGAPDHIIEPETQPPHPLYLYGAGHVGRAVVRALQDLPFAIQWVDVAADRFPEEIPPNATPVVTIDPATVATTAPPDALHLIMTFSHALDLNLCHAVLGRDFAWAGLIGSGTKRVRFEKRLREAGIGEAALARLACPIGIAGITGKEPAMIAISVAAQLAAWASAGGLEQVASERQHG